MPYCKLHGSLCRGEVTPLPDDPGPMVRRRQLGVALRQYRLAADLTVTEVATRLLVAPSKISRIENAQRNASVRDVRDLCEIYGIADDLIRKNLMELARGSRAKAWWQDSRIDAAMHAVIGMEGSATQIREFSLSYVPGLLQTRSYANALTSAYLTDDLETLKGIIDARMRRKEIFEQQAPPHLDVILDEAVLCRLVGGRAVMREQLDCLVMWAGSPHVMVRVMPFSAGAHAGLNGGFTLLDFPDGNAAEERAVPSGVYTETVDGAVYQDQPAEVQRYLTAWGEIDARTLDRADSLSLLRVRAGEL